MRKLCVVTGTRAEYGLLKHLMHAIKQSHDFQLQLVVCAAHLLPQQGNTKQEIIADGFLIDAEIDMLLASNTPLAVAKATGLGLLGFADAFARLKPDAVVLLGDRFEALAAAQAAFLQRIPVIHLHGGELTLGALDDAIRHAITKLSVLHFVAHEDYARRVCQLGEEDWRVQVVGPMVADALTQLTWLSRDGLAQDLGLNPDKRWVLLTYHPETLGSQDDIEAVDAIYEALRRQLPDAEYIWTYPNMDAGGERILSWLLAKAKTDNRVKAVSSLGQQRYLSVMKESIAVIGNSSSGLLEAPLLGVPTINMGQRQTGRLKAESVLDCVANAAMITEAIQQVIVWRQKMYESQPLSVAPSQQILAFLRQVEWGRMVHKIFVDKR
ncbi:MAG: UDP-N-acetylglucosamine 2-epimerase (hydrolyzing) [Thiotrichales bacterium]|nr:MAG: UDP-N-acetylglucosamine 2-epimerase (hydrolyzing) [Thiotrichales bacterium]